MTAASTWANENLNDAERRCDMDGQHGIPLLASYPVDDTIPREACKHSDMYWLPVRMTRHANSMAPGRFDSGMPSGQVPSREVKWSALSS